MESQKRFTELEIGGGGQACAKVCIFSGAKGKGGVEMRNSVGYVMGQCCKGGVDGWLMM